MDLQEAASSLSRYLREATNYQRKPWFAVGCAVNHIIIYHEGQTCVVFNEDRWNGYDVKYKPIGKGPTIGKSE